MLPPHLLLKMLSNREGFRRVGTGTGKEPFHPGSLKPVPSSRPPRETPKTVWESRGAPNSAEPSPLLLVAPGRRGWGNDRPLLPTRGGACSRGERLEGVPGAHLKCPLAKGWRSPCAQQAWAAKDYQSWSLLVHPRGVCTCLQIHALRAGCRRLPAGRTLTHPPCRFCGTVTQGFTRGGSAASREQVAGKCVSATARTFKERSLMGKASRARLALPREVWLRKNKSQNKTPAAPVGLLFSVKCAKPRGSFNTPEIVPRGLPCACGAGCWGASAAPPPPMAPHGAPVGLESGRQTGSWERGEPRRRLASPG